MERKDSVGTRLRNLIKTQVDLLMTSHFGGKGRLNKRDISELQNYFGIAIRQNADNLIDMKKAVGAVGDIRFPQKLLLRGANIKQQN